jgi:predicted Ser/Thr protein kinase/phage FluMu protein Com
VNHFLLFLIFHFEFLIAPMPQVIRCPHCTKSMQVPDNAGGKNVRCPSCKKPFTIPAAAGAVPKPAAPAPAAVPVSGNGAKGAVAAPAPAPLPTICPSCGSKLLEGAIACMDCGYLLQAETGPQEPEGPPNLCTNPACGVANPPGERNCQRCGSALPTAAGTLLHGRYRLDKLLKMGGFGAVYMATDTKHGNRPVAIKDMIGADPQEFQIRLNFFRREAEILRSLETVPIVPRVYDFIQQGQTAHLVMEFIRGKDLLDLMEANANKPFPLQLVVEWGKSVCDVLATMHSQSPPLIHRDLKPDNIMLLEDQRSIKMIDFGTARDLGRTAQERAAGKTRVYTEGYAPPEQIVGKPEARSDLFALAATLYHLATGKAPEGFYTAKELENQLADAKSALPAAYRWFFELLKINLNEDVNDRYFSAREFKADLERQRVSTEVSCPKCKTVNKVRTPYCSKCAEALTDPTAPCTSCGKFNRMGSRCCIHCGNRLR